METTFNKDNWTGETATINVNVEEKSFNYYDYRVQLEQVDTGDDDEYYRILVDGDKVGSVMKLSYEDTYLAMDSISELTREDKDPFVAAAKMLSNVL